MKQLQGMLAFVEAAAAGSLAGAARRLELTPAAISKSLATLERRLGVRLLQRSTRSLALTPEGEAFLAKARDALRLLDEAVAEVSQASEAPAGRVRLSVGFAFGRRFLLPALPALQAAHPKLEIECEFDNRPVDLIAQGFDLGIRGGPTEDSRLVARRICALPVVLLASPAYLRRHGVPERVEDLAAHRAAVVRFARGDYSVWHFRGTGRGAPAIEIAPPARTVVNDSEAAMHVALADGGIAQAGLHHALPWLRNGRLKLVLPQLHDAGRREVVLHYPHRQYLAPRVRVVVDALLAHFRDTADLHLTPAEALAAHPEWAAAPPAALSGASAGAGTRGRSAGRAPATAAPAPAATRPRARRTG